MRLHNVTTQRRVTAQALSRLRLKIKKSMEVSSVSVSEDLHQDINSIMNECSNKALSDHPADSFARIFWQQQLQAATAPGCQRRYHPLMIKWALYLRHQSSRAYDLLRESGVIALPSQRTPRDYTYFLESSIGFLSEVDQHLVDTVKVDTLADYQKCVAVVMDEMHVKEDLVYNKHSGNLVGFTNLGHLNNQLLEYERSLHDEKELPQLAKSMLVFFVRGLFVSLNFPYAQFACKSVSGDLLFTPFWEAVFRLERMGFKVVAATADGASSNRRFFALNTDPGTMHKTLNPYAAEGRYIHFFSDPPHLLKTARNCFASIRLLQCKQPHH